LSSFIFLYILLSVPILSTVIHEIGHYVVLKKFTRKDICVSYYRRKIRVGIEKDYRNLTDTQRLYVYLYGVLLGLVPFIIVGYFYNALALLWIIPYLSLCANDLLNIFKIIKCI